MKSCCSQRDVHTSNFHANPSTTVSSTTIYFQLTAKFYVSYITFVENGLDIRVVGLKFQRAQLLNARSSDFECYNWKFGGGSERDGLAKKKHNNRTRHKYLQHP